MIDLTSDKRVMRGLFRQLSALLNRRERGQATLLLLAMVVQATTELVGVASIAPFMGVVADTSLLRQNKVLAHLYLWGGFVSDTTFLIAMGCAVIAALVVSNGVSALTTWAMLRFVWNTHDRLATRLLGGYLAQPYAFFIQRNTASLNNEPRPKFRQRSRKCCYRRLLRLPALSS